MVFMKKGATPSKTPQFKKGKKAVQVKQEEEEMDFDDMDDSDDDVDSDEAPQQKTPANKGAKGRQSLSEKKVSFSIPGKNSPAVKTPKKDNSILVKKQPTPANKGKTAMQEFKGMKGNNQSKKEMEGDDDDDDDDEDDSDDFDVEEGGEDDDLDLELDEEDDDDDDDDDDDEDDDDDDDDEDNDKGNIQQKLALLKQNDVQQNKQKTPVKGNKAKNAESPKEKTPKKELEQKSSPKTNPPQQLVEEIERRRERDARMLFVGGLPNDIKAEEIKSLSSDIVDVSLPFLARKHQSKTVFGFLSFNSEAKAESNYKSLQNKKLRGQPLQLDFVGLKSKNRKVSEDSQSTFNLKKLYVSGIPVDATIDKVAKHFPLAFQITLNQSPLFRIANIYFNTEDEARAAYESNKDIEISGQKLVVLYSKSGGAPTKKRKHNRKVASKNSSFGGGMNKNSSFSGKNKNNSFGNPAKKMKFTKKSAGGDEE